MSKQFQNFDRNPKQSSKPNIQIQNPYQLIYNEKVFSTNITALKGAKSEKEAQEVVRHLGMLYNTLGSAMKDVVKIMSNQFLQEKQQKLQSSSKSKSPNAVIQVVQMIMPASEEEEDDKIKQKRQQAKKNLFKEMMAENDELYLLSSKSQDSHEKPNPFKNLLPESNAENNIEIDEIDPNIQKPTQKQDQQKFPSLSQVLREKIIGEKKIESPKSKKNNGIENLLSDQSQNSNMLKHRDNTIKAINNNKKDKQHESISIFQQIDISKEGKRSNEKPVFSQKKINQSNLLTRKIYTIQSKDIQHKTVPLGKNNKQRDDQQFQLKIKSQHKNYKNQKQIKDPTFAQINQSSKNTNTILTRSKAPKVYEIISLDDDEEEQQWLEDHIQNKKNTQVRRQNNHQIDSLKKALDNNNSENKVRQIQNNNSSMKKKFRGQSLGMVCSFCNKFFANETYTQNCCQCKRLESRCQENEIITREICFGDLQ